MKIAVAGTHGVGKTTLIEEFLRRHPEFQHEPEPYEVLAEDYGEEFAAEPCVEDFLRQLEFNLERLKQHAATANIIYERCPLDFLAYLSALGANVSETLLEQISAAVQQLDLIVYLPLEDKTRQFHAKAKRKTQSHEDSYFASSRLNLAPLRETNDEFPKLRRAVDRQLSEILTETNVRVVEAIGSTTQRLHTLENALDDMA